MLLSYGTSFVVCVVFFFFFKQKTAYEMRISDWSSDVCSSDLDPQADLAGRARARELGACRARRLPHSPRAGGARAARGPARARPGAGGLGLGVGRAQDRKRVV